MAVFVNQDVVRFDIAIIKTIKGKRESAAIRWTTYIFPLLFFFFFHSPMDETKVMDGLDRENALCDIEPGHVLREGIVLDQHRHQVTPSQELHDEIQVGRVLE